ncbi:uncharacterized protein PAC_11625 [Phialocephala subalpina]|uniref:C2H2-type domain-containing protein n=1 Tax=Phialocephala subalpina TaxID=576137 RepID=A0A1L7X9L2_9HELO|nr:uncharacterized protein PAC_11625 [Phialocephala subalpina]
MSHGAWLPDETFNYTNPDEEDTTGHEASYGSDTGYSNPGSNSPPAASANYGNPTQEHTFPNFDMASYRDNLVTTASSLELPYGVGPGQILQLGTTMPLTAEPTLNNVESQPNFLPQSPSEQILGDSEVGSASELFQCTYCSKMYTAQYKLTLAFCQSLIEKVSAYQIARKHEHVHTKPRQCHLCPFATAERKDLHRHFWAHHEEYAQANSTPDDRRVCPDCGQRSRSDNLSRHKRRKHGHRSSS